MGTMQGHYVMQDEEGETFHIDIPVFRLAVETHIH
jgi:ApaG protein